MSFARLEHSIQVKLEESNTDKETTVLHGVLGLYTSLRSDYWRMHAKNESNLKKKESEIAVLQDKLNQQHKQQQVETEDGAAVKLQNEGNESNQSSAESNASNQDAADLERNVAKPSQNESKDEAAAAVAKPAEISPSQPKRKADDLQQAEAKRARSCGDGVKRPVIDLTGKNGALEKPVPSTSVRTVLNAKTYCKTFEGNAFGFRMTTFKGNIYVRRNDKGIEPARGDMIVAVNNTRFVQGTTLDQASATMRSALSKGPVKLTFLKDEKTAAWFCKCTAE